MDLEPRLLRYFLAVAQELHFGRAAARLYISQPSLSNQIRNLERVLGTDLFVRNSRQVALTPAGRALLEEAPLALSTLERAAERARLAGAGIAGTVRLGYAPMAGYETLGAVLAAAEHDSPNLTVIASELFSSEVPGRVLAGDLDVGLALFPEPMRGVRSRLLRAEPLALAPDQQAYPKHLTTPGECKTEDLRHRHSADIQTGAVLGHVDNGALDPWRIGRRNQESRLVQVDPHTLAAAGIFTVSRHRFLRDRSAPRKTNPESGFAGQTSSFARRPPSEFLKERDPNAKPFTPLVKPKDTPRVIMRRNA